MGCFIPRAMSPKVLIRSAPETPACYSLAASIAPRISARAGPTLAMEAFTGFRQRDTRVVRLNNRTPGFFSSVVSFLGLKRDLLIPPAWKPHRATATTASNSKSPVGCCIAFSHYNTRLLFAELSPKSFFPARARYGFELVQKDRNRRIKTL